MTPRTADTAPTKQKTPLSTPPPKRGADLLHDPLLNKGTAFTHEERRQLGILGLLPPAVSTQEVQRGRALNSVRKGATDLDKYLEMLSLLDRNESLYYQLLIENTEELMPIVYTPTVGKGCQLYGHIYRRARGLFITRHERGMVREVLANWPHKDVRVIVVTDGERILGLGDLGSSGMGIPVGKLSLYTACGGVPPSQTLPITIDVGTNNETFLKDPLYLGVREKRITGKEYDDLIEEFVLAVQELFPKALIQFEDFANHNAFRLLAKYRDRAFCFNDDIQGTAGVTLAGLYSASRITGRTLREEKLLFLGAGEAAIGIADLVVSAMVADGAERGEALKRCWFVDSKGLVEKGRKDLQDHKKPYAHAFHPVSDLAAAVRELEPTCLIGVSGKPQQFTEEIVALMARINDRPLVFALSNPTANAECTAEQAYTWSGGRAIFASGSPFPAVQYDGKRFVPGQSNNSYIFPGVGMGAVACGAKRITDEMFFEAARALASRVSNKDLEQGSLFPPLSIIRDVSAHVAAATAQVAYQRGLATEPKPKNLLAFIRSKQYQPEYPKYA